MRKILSGMLALGVATGVSLGVAAPAYAATDGFNVIHSPGGLGGYITVRTAGPYGSTVNIRERQSVGSGEVNGGPLPYQIQAGSGYCVWEELYDGPVSSQVNHKIGDFNYGKSLSSRFFTLEGYKRYGYDYGRFYQGYLRVYAC